MVSIIVITYNARDDLKECLKSLQDQDYDQIEIIIVDDASTDGTKQYLERYKTDINTDAVILTNDSNLGVAGARNVGIERSKGDIIAFIDADCIADAVWISELVKGYCNKDVVAVGGSISDERITNIWELLNKGHDFIASEEGYVTYIQGCNMSYGAPILKTFLFNDEIKYGYEETLLCDKLIQAGHKIYYRPQAIVHHKHRTCFISMAKQKYLRGISSVWYRKKQKKLFMFKRHIVLLAAFLFALISFFGNHLIYIHLAIFLFLIFSYSLLKDEIVYKQNNLKEITKVFPFLIVIEIFHFMGSVAGLLKFRFFGTHGRIH